MRNHKSNALFLLISLMLFFYSCSEKEVGIADEGEAHFSYSVDAVFDQEAGSRVAKPMKGTMTIHSHETNTDQILDWFVTLDEDLKTLTSSMKSVLPFGVYDFRLVLDDGTGRYLGESKNVTVGSDETVALSIAPVIGNVSPNITLNKLPNLKFSFPLAELQTLTEPKLGYIIDGGVETIVALSKIEEFNAFHFDLAAGAHTMKLNLYDGAVLVGTSIPAQESFTVKNKVDIKMDIVPLYAKTTMSSTVDGGEAQMSVAIPQEVVLEAGGIANISGAIKLTSTRNGLIEQPLTIAAAGDDFVGTATLPNCFYDNATLALEFRDVAADEVVGHAVETNVTLSSGAVVANLQLDIKRRVLASGNLLAVATVNVYNKDNSPAAGATVYLNVEPVGVVGSDGTLEFFTKAGDYTLRADKDQMQGAAQVEISPLGVYNYTLTLDESTFVPSRFLWMAKENSSSDNEIIYWNGYESVALTDNDMDEDWLRVDGDEAMWMTRNNATSRFTIYHWDGTTVKTVIADVHGFNGFHFSNGHIVWISNVNNIGQIFLWDGSSIQQITDDTNYKRSPHNNGGRIAWVSSINGQEVISYWDGATEQVISTAYRNNFPRVCETYVTWIGCDTDFIYNTFVWENGVETQISTTAYADQNSVVHDDNTFWYGEAKDGTQPDVINYYDGSTSSIVTTDLHNSVYIRDAYGENVIWREINSGIEELYLWDGTSKKLIQRESGINLNIDLVEDNAIWTVTNSYGKSDVYFWNGEEVTQVTSTNAMESNPFILK